MTNMETLVQAGVITDPSQVSAEMQAKVNALTPEEVTHLISVKAKLGEGDLKAHGQVMMF